VDIEKILAIFKDRAIVLLAFGQTLTWAGLYYIFPALLLRWEQELGWSKADLTGAIALAMLISAASSPFAGRIIDKGRGPLLMAGSALCGGIGLLVLSTVTALWQFYLVWAFIGLTLSGCLYEPCFALVTRARGKDAKRGIILITLVAGFASTISFPTTYLMAEMLGWRGATTLSGLMVILLAVPLLWLGAHEIEASRNINVATGSSNPNSRNDFIKKPVFWFLAMGFALLAIVHGATLHHLLPLLDDRGLSNQMAVLAASFVGPMQVAGRLVMMASEKYVSHHGLTVAAYMMMAMSVILLMLSGSSPIFLATFVIFFGGAYGTVSILRPLIARDILGEQNFGAKSGALAFPYLMGTASAPYLGSIVWDKGGYNTMLLLLMIVAVAGFALYLVAHRLTEEQNHAS